MTGSLNERVYDALMAARQRELADEYAEANGLPATDDRPSLIGRRVRLRGSQWGGNLPPVGTIVTVIVDHSQHDGSIGFDGPDGSLAWAWLAATEGSWGGELLDEDPPQVGAVGKYVCSVFDRGALSEPIAFSVDTISEARSVIERRGTWMYLPGRRDDGQVLLSDGAFVQVWRAPAPHHIDDTPELKIAQALDLGWSPDQTIEVGPKGGLRTLRNGVDY